MTQSNEGWIKTTCAYCGVGCGVEARPKMSGELEVRGDKSHPANYGKLCTKGIALGETVIHDGRMISPAITLNNISSETSWDTATDLVAKRFSETIQEFGPDSVAFYVSGQLLTEDYYVANKLMKGFIGSANIDSNSRLCMASSVVGHKRAFGTDTVPICYEDIEEADLVILVGSNLAWCHPVLFQRLRTAKQNNSKLTIINIDPRKTETNSISDIHLAINSGGDVALFNGLLAFLNDNGHFDEDYVHSHTNNFEDALASALDESNIELKTGLRSDQLGQFYNSFSNTEKVITIYSQGVNQSTSGSDKVNSIINCHLATKKIGGVGKGPFSVTGQPNAMGGREVGALANTLASHMEFDNSEHIELIQEFWNTRNTANKPGLKAIDMFDAVNSGQIKAIWIMATNPMVSLPNSSVIQSALEKCPFVVVSDCIADTETSQFADVVLPAQGWSEKSGTVTNSERRISRQRRILPSPGQAKPDWWIISEVAKKMGFENEFDYLHEGQIFQEYAQLSTVGNLQGERDFTLEGLTELSDKEYNQLLPQQWPVKEYQASIVNQRFFENHRFYTQNQKANLIPVKHIEPKLKVDQKYPLLLNTGRTRDQWHTMSRTGLSAKLGEFDAEPYVLINPLTALDYEIKNNDLVSISNDSGHCQARAVVTEDMGINQVYMPIHWNRATAKNAKPSTLTQPNTDPISGQPEFKHTPVKIELMNNESAAIFIVDQVLDFDDFDYWSRQKIENGYLYRIESKLSVENLAFNLKSLMVKTENLDVTFDGANEHQYISLSGGIKQVVSVSSDLLNIDNLKMIELFSNKDVFDATTSDATSEEIEVTSVT